MTSVRDQFLDYMAENGVVPADPNKIRAGDFCRFQLANEPRGKRSGWCKFFDDDMPQGEFGDWRVHQNEGLKWRPKRQDRRELSDEEKRKLHAEIKRRSDQKKREQERIRQEAASSSKLIWDESEPVPRNYPYLEKKKVMPHNLKLYKWALVVPVLKNGNLVGLQFISPEGEKRFKFGTDLVGAYSNIGKPEPGKPIVICEGWATAASIREATGHMVIVAFNAGNLEPVARAIREKLPESEIIIAADNDRFTFEPIPNPGVHFATIAADACKGRLLVPYFEPSLQGKLTDFNDLAVAVGIDEVRAQFEGKKIQASVMAPQKIEDASLPAELLFSKKRNISIHGTMLAKELRTSLIFDAVSQEWFCYKDIWEPIHSSRFDFLLTELLNKLYVDYSAKWLREMKEFLRIRLGTKQFSGNFEWNLDKSLLPMANGVLNVHTKELKSYAPDQYFNWQLPYDYDPIATCPTIDDYLTTLSNGDEEVERLAIAYFWAILHGRADLQKYLELIGRPGTGKGTYIKLAMALVGERNVISTTMEQLSGNRFETANLYGKKLCVITDADGWTKSFETFKGITGQDPIRFEVKGKQQSQPFVYGGLMLLAANAPIRSMDKSTALVRRRLTIYIDHRLPKEKLRSNFYSVLTAEMPGLLNRILKLDYNETESFIRNYSKGRDRALIDTDSVALWLTERCEYEIGAWSAVGSFERNSSGDIANAMTQLFPSYLQFCVHENIPHRATKQDFSARLIEVGGELGMTLSYKRSSVGVRGIQNLRLKFNPTSSN